jgi:xylan 1,4-beta-xylosidase
VDRIYDGLLERGVRPFVELSFMPHYLASGKSTFGFYKGNITPPTAYADWGNFVKAFVQHLIDRYGSTEVRQWYFEVWNEPNLGVFWTGKQADYFEIFKVSVMAVKSVDPKLMVGGPSTAQIAWIPEFLSYCDTNRLPVDFVSTHLYPGDDQKPIFGAANSYPQSDVIPAAMAKVKAWIDASPYRGVPLWLTEWSSDSPAMIAHIIKGCLGVCDAMSHWTMSGTYEELGPSTYVLKEGDNGFGMFAPGNIPKPQFNTYKLLHRLGNQRLWASNGPVLASKKKDGSFAIGVWNLAEIPQPLGIPGLSPNRTAAGSRKSIEIRIKGARRGQKASVTYVDQERGSPYPAWRRLGSLQYPRPDELNTIRKSAELQPPETVTIGAGGVLTLDLPPECFALIELKPL